jgi:hypothetical protein
MSDAAQLRALIEEERPLLVVPEIEAIATAQLQELEAEGLVRVVPTARAARLTMDREGIRRLAAETLSLPTSPYRFCDSLDALQTAIDAGIGYPCIVKPVMSSSGKGQSRLDGPDDVVKAWDYAMAGGRVAKGRVIVEGFIDFEYEITLLTVRARAADGTIQTSFCEPIGHLQVSGDYVESWQPQRMSALALQRAQAIAKAVTDDLGRGLDGEPAGLGLFGVELLFGWCFIRLNIWNKKILLFFLSIQDNFILTIHIFKYIDSFMYRNNILFYFFIIGIDLYRFVEKNIFHLCFCDIIVELNIDNMTTRFIRNTFYSAGFTRTWRAR